MAWTAVRSSAAISFMALRIQESGATPKGRMVQWGAGLREQCVKVQLQQLII